MSVARQNLPASPLSRAVHPALLPFLPQRAPVHVVPFVLAGCGVVGSALLRLLEERAAQLEALHGVRFELRKLLVRDVGRQREASIAAGVLSNDVENFLQSDASMLVEVIGGTQAAQQLVQTALLQGRDVITANKALLAESADALSRLALASGTRLEFEAAVGGGVPIIHTLRESLAHTGVRTIRGILNGTSNFILTRLAEGHRYADALAEAQRAGLAEADPSRDLDGSDVADKIRILAWLAFGIDPAALKVEQRGILPDPDGLARMAAAESGVLRLMAECSRIGGKVYAWVRPVVVKPGSAWAATRNEDNLIVVETAWNGTVSVAGAGAGGMPTASALLADMLRTALWRRDKAG